MKLSHEELKQLKSIQRAINKLKINRNLKAFTVGDDNICIYDADVYDKNFQPGKEVGTIVYDSGADLFQLKFPFSVESTCG